MLIIYLFWPAGPVVAYTIRSWPATSQRQIRHPELWSSVKRSNRGKRYANLLDCIVYLFDYLLFFTRKTPRPVTRRSPSTQNIPRQTSPWWLVDLTQIVVNFIYVPAIIAKEINYCCPPGSISPIDSFLSFSTLWPLVVFLVFGFLGGNIHVSSPLCPSVVSCFITLLINVKILVPHPVSGD